ncbi:MAG: YceI family protein [Gammaproteobacteria bacterium]|nr:YceI family protein [Gammaproteobacteria bacterium]MBU1775657.1 YceI family protein [Gammaproteobacteria bacterium]MBU1967639.1 YceI family protein [Gammaproteobacteria bacterium]
MDYRVAVIFAAVLAFPARAADSYTIDPTHTWPVFEVSHMGFSTQRGRFNKTSGKIMLDVAAKKGSVDITIDAASIDMGFVEWNKHMRDINFFNTAQFPTMRFVSEQLVFEGDKPVVAKGELTLLGTPVSVTLSIDGFKCGTHPMLRKEMCGANISATIKRSDFGMSRFIPTIGDEVRIFSPVEAFRD